MSVAFDTRGSGGATGSTSLTSPLTWTHTCGASATILLVGVAIDGAASPGVTIASTAPSVTYNSVAMSLVGSQPSGGAGQTAGFIAVYKLVSPGTGSAFTVSVSWTATHTDKASGSSLSFTGGSTIGTVTTNDSGGASVSAGTGTTSSTSGNQCVNFATNGSDSSVFSAGTVEFNTGTTGSGAAGNCTGAILSSTGSTVTFTWAQTSDFYAGQTFEVKVGGGAVVHGGPVVSPDGQDVVSENIAMVGRALNIASYLVG